MFTKDRQAAPIKTPPSNEGYTIKVTSLPERLQWVMDKHNINQVELAQLLGIDKQNVNHLLHGRTKRIKLEYAMNLAPLLNINPYWLANGTEPVYIDKSQRNDKSTVLEDGPPLISLRAVPVVGSVQAGDNGLLQETQYPVGLGEGYLEWPTKDANAYALRVRGDSMEPRVRSGEFVIVEPNLKPDSGDDVVAIFKDGRRMLKRLLVKKDGEFMLASINETHNTITVFEEELEALHLVGGYCPSGRFVKTKVVI